MFCEEIVWFMIRHRAKEKLFKNSKIKFSKNTTNLLSIKVATCFDS